MRVVGLVSSFREGRLLSGAVASLLMLDGILIAEGPVEGNPPEGPESELNWGAPLGDPRIKRFDGEWETDAAKRTWMLDRAKQTWPGELWGLWLDGDEVLLWGQYLHDWIWRAEQMGDPDEPVGGWPLPLVELDGSVVLCMGKVVRLDLIRSYDVSSSLITMVNGTRRTVGNFPVWNPIDGPTYMDADGKPRWRARPPLHGEPHLLHRSWLRDRSRAVERQSAAEERNYRGVELPGGVRVNGSE